MFDAEQELVELTVSWTEIGPRCSTCGAPTD